MGSGSSTIAPSPTVVVNVDRNKDGPPGALPPATCDKHGDNCFWGAVAAPYLTKAGLKANALEDPGWVKDPATADKVAAAVMQWALDRGGSSFAHWFQPMCGFKRHGQSGCVQLAMFEVGNDRKCFWQLRGKDLLRGETDGSSYPSGNLRATHMAGAYLTIDPLSAMFLSDDCIMIPACMVSYAGEALDEKTPLHRAEQALSREGVRLFKLLGHSIGGLYTNIGLEQELFFVPDDAYKKRPDLVMTGRTLLGRRPAVTQKGDTHYMAPLNRRRSVYACMKEIQAEAFKLGIPLKTRHREVAPNQYEFAPLFGRVVEQVDNNLMVMQICEEVAPKHGLRALLAEKPFAGVNGSGKHNNWSISTTSGAQLLNPENLAKHMGGDGKVFPLVMACIITAIDEYGDLMRLSISSPGNDYRLGAMEAPPAIISTHLGERMTKFLTDFADGNVYSYTPGFETISLGVDYLPTVDAPSEDRNRTSPFPYGGHRFEFRAVGSSQNVSLVNTVLSSIVAFQFKKLADAIEGGADGVATAQAMLKKHMKAVFNGNGYDEAWPIKAAERGLFVIPSGVDAMKSFVAPKNVAMFEAVKVFSAQECQSRKYILLEQYINTVQEEVLCLIDMIKRDVIPAVTANPTNAATKAADLKFLDGAIKQLEGDMQDIMRLEEEAADAAAEADKIADLEQVETHTPREGETIPVSKMMTRHNNKYEDNPGVTSQPRYETCADLDQASTKARQCRLERVRDIRAKIDEMEENCPRPLWTLPAYEELLFNDQLSS